MQNFTHIDPQEAFEAAIHLGLLSARESDDNFAGHYMYMGTTEDHGHGFKHRMTRDYVWTL